MKARKYPPNASPVATCSTCNFGGVCIMELQQGIDDYVITAENYGEGYIRVSKSRIQYTAQGKPFFVRQRQRWYLSEFMRTN